MQSISNRISARLFLLSSVVTLVALAGVLALMDARLKRQMHDKAESSIAFLAEVLTPRLWTLDEEGTVTMADAMAQDGAIGFLEITDSAGTILYSKGTLDDATILKEADISHRGHFIGHVRMGISDAMRRTAMWTVAFVGAGMAALIILVHALISGNLLKNYFKRPLADVAKLAKAYSEGDYKALGSQEPYEEFQPLMQTLQGMGRTIHKQVLTLKENEERYRAIFNNSPMGIYRTTLDGQFVEVNPALVAILGYDSREELLATKHTSIAYYANPAEREALIEDLRQSPEGIIKEITLKTKEGVLVSAYLHASLSFGPDGEPAFMDGSIEDITERRHMQEMMVQSEKMVSVGGIAAGIAHEINNPLGIILQTAQNLEQRTRPDFRKNIEAAEKIGLDMKLLDAYMRKRRIHSFVDNIQTAALRAAAIIRHMLDFSRRSESKRALCDLREVLDKSIMLAASDYDLKKDYDFRKIKIIKEYPATLPMVECTETEIEQVVLNLLRNAAQAMAGIENPELVLKITHTDKHQRIEVRDNGPGMGPEVRRKVFEPFFTTKPTGEGTGLGLSVSYFIVTRGHGGKMSVESAPGEGTTFIIELPTTADCHP